MLSCSELSTIYGMTPSTFTFAASYLQKQWTLQNCTSSMPSCQEISDSYDLPNGEWADYAPKGVKAQFRAYNCESKPLPNCQALSDYYLINHAQIDPSHPSTVGIADRLILSKYSRWGCHHMFRDCQTLSNYFGLGLNQKTNRITTSGIAPHWAKTIFKFRQCGTSPMAGTDRGVKPAAIV